MPRTYPDPPAHVSAQEYDKRCMQSGGVTYLSDLEFLRKNADALAAELERLAAAQPWLRYTYSQIRELYTRLNTRLGLRYDEPLCVAVSGEAWKIANVASPHFSDPDSASRRDG